MITKKFFHSKNKLSGFTIVELLVVIVVISILAAFTVVSYVGIGQKAEAASLQSETSSASKRLKLYYVEHSAYPKDFDASGCPRDVNDVVDSRYCLKLNSDHSFSYTSSPPYSDYSLTVSKVNSTLAYVVTSTTPPTLVEGTPVLTYKQIVAGGSVTCAIASNDKLYCWGRGTTGQLGDGLLINSIKPVLSDAGAIAGKTIKSISAGNSTVCAIANDDKAYCWGNNAQGQVGNNTKTSPVSTPVAVNTGLSFKSVQPGSVLTCGIAFDDKVYCWGGANLMGNGTVVESLTPTAIDVTGALSGKTIRSLSVGYAYACVVTTDNSAYCWGQNLNGEIGDGSYGGGYTRLTPTAVDTSASSALNGLGVLSISAGLNQTCAIATDNNAYCWGLNTSGQLGETTVNSPKPYAVATYRSGILTNPTSLTIKSIGTSGSGTVGNTCALASNDKMYCWGTNTWGELGNGLGVQSNEPVAVDISGALSGKTIKSFSTGGSHTCVIASDNKAYCWGKNNGGQVGVNTVTDRYFSPVEVYALP